LIEVARAWPRVFAQPPTGTQPIAFQDGRFVVLCANEAALGLIAGNEQHIVGLLNRVLDGKVVVEHIEAVEATRTEMFLAHDLLAIKTLMVDIAPGLGT
jgi:hypothetical protein